MATSAESVRMRVLAKILIAAIEVEDGIKPEAIQPIIHTMTRMQPSDAERTFWQLHSLLNEARK